LSESDVGNMDQGLPPNLSGIATGEIEARGTAIRARRQDLPVDARAMQGVWLLIGSLGVFFFASILLYVVYIAMRLQSERAITQPLILPWSFIPSTLLLIGVSVCLEWGLRAARRDRNVQVKRLVVAACVMGIGFLFIQSDGMNRLLIGLSLIHI
jgi:cytochrome c oxidase subunit 3